MKTEDKIIYDACPHCGQKLSNWEQTLLKVDHALVCKNCWYRILLPAADRPPKQNEPPEEKEDQ